MTIQFIQHQINDIIYMYKVNYKIPNIARKYNCSKTAILRLLKLNNIIKHQHIYVLKSQHIYCKYCDNVKHFDEFNNHSDSKFGKRVKCKLCEKSYRDKNQDKIKLNYNKTQDKIKNYRKSYRINNKDKINIYFRNKYHNDSNYKIALTLRNRIKLALNEIDKAKSTLDLLGCTIEEFKSYLQQTAIDNGYIDFDINNYSGQEYHIDHIRPCILFDLSKPENQEICFHYTNMQILSAKDNLMKGDKLL